MCNLKLNKCNNCSIHCKRKNLKSVSSKLKTQIDQKGFSKLDFNDLFEAADTNLEDIRKYSSSMPMDRTDGGVGRARLYGKAYLHPWMPKGQDIVHVPERYYKFNEQRGLEYTQPAIVNSVAKGKRRVFSSFPKDLYTNPLVENITRVLWEALPLTSGMKKDTFVVGYHLVKLAPSGELPAVASPNKVHRDGEWYTAAVLIDRKNARGGENIITNTCWHDYNIDDVNPHDIYSEFTLRNPLEGYIVADDRVAHYVGPVFSVDQEVESERTILLIDFTPVCAAINLTGIAA